MSNVWFEIPSDLSLSRRIALQDKSKALSTSTATVRVALKLLQTLELLSDTTVRRSVVGQEELKP